MTGSHRPPRVGGAHDPESDDGLTARLDDLERPKAHLLVPGREQPLRAAFHHPAVHRLLPSPASIGLGYLRGWAGATLRAGASWREHARLARGEAEDTPATRALARDLQINNAVLTELNWLPERARDMPLRGLEHLERVTASGRGVVVASVHVGPVLALVYALAARGYKVYVAGGHRAWEPPTNRQVIFMNREVEAAGARWVHLGGAFPVLSALLERGELVFMFFDRPGRLPSRLGGRPAMLSGAVGDLLLHSGAVAVPAFAVHRRGRIRGELREPLEVRPGESSEAVVHRLAAEFDDVIEKYGGQALPLLAEAWRAGAAETAHKHLGE